MLDEITTTTTMTGKTSTHRKINKLMMEKRRRTRINNCLVELKTLVLKALKKDGEQFSKLEKVDILEMTVKYLRFLHQQSQVNLTTDSLSGKYRVPLDLSAEVIHFMNGEEARTRLTDHMSKCVRVPSASPPSLASVSNSQPTPMPAHQQQKQIHVPQTTENFHPAHPLSNIFIKNTGHIIVPVSSKHPENSLTMTGETTYKPMSVGYPSPAPVSPKPSTSGTHPRHMSTSTHIPSAISPATSPNILQLKTMVTENNLSSDCYVSAVPLYLGTMHTASHTAPTLASYYASQSVNVNIGQETDQNLPVWRPW